MDESSDVSSSTPNVIKRTATKVCRVCGDKAIGYNFNVITCESCKAFFRRNALAVPTVLPCPYNDDCRVTKASRRHCQHCRLRKCFEVGMTTTGILKDRALTYKRSQYRRRKGVLETTMSPIGFDVASPALTPHDCPSCTCAQTASPLALPLNTPKEESLDADALKEHYATMERSSSMTLRPSIIRPTACAMTDVDDTALLNELLAAGDLIVNDQGPIANGEPTDVFRDPLAGILAGMDKVMRMFIACFRRTTAFNSLTRQDQSVLLKRGCYDMIVMRCMWVYDFEQKLWMPVKSLQWFVFRPDTLGKVSQGMMERNLKVVQSMNPQWLEDDALMMIMVACTLYNAQRGGLGDVMAVTQASNLYRALLRTYLLEKTYAGNGRHADYAYNALLGKLDEVALLSDDVSEFFRADLLDKIGPLLAELFSR